MDILELNMAHELAHVDQDSLFMVFLDLQKEYNKVYLGRLLMNLEVYVAGPHMCSILVVFWYQW